MAAPETELEQRFPGIPPGLRAFFRLRPDDERLETLAVLNEFLEDVDLKAFRESAMGTPERRAAANTILNGEWEPHIHLLDRAMTTLFDPLEALVNTTLLKYNNAVIRAEREWILYERVVADYDKYHAPETTAAERARIGLRAWFAIGVDNKEEAAWNQQPLFRYAGLKSAGFSEEQVTLLSLERMRDIQKLLEATLQKLRTRLEQQTILQAMVAAASGTGQPNLVLQQGATDAEAASPWRWFHRVLGEKLDDTRDDLQQRTDRLISNVRKTRDVIYMSREFIATPDEFWQWLIGKNMNWQEQRQAIMTADRLLRWNDTALVSAPLLNKETRKALFAALLVVAVIHYERFMVPTSDTNRLVGWQRIILFDNDTDDARDLITMFLQPNHLVGAAFNESRLAHFYAQSLQEWVRWRVEQDEPRSLPREADLLGHSDRLLQLLMQQENSSLRVYLGNLASSLRRDLDDQLLDQGVRREYGQRLLQQEDILRALDAPPVTLILPESLTPAPSIRILDTVLKHDAAKASIAAVNESTRDLEKIYANWRASTLTFQVWLREILAHRKLTSAIVPTALDKVLGELDEQSKILERKAQLLGIVYIQQWLRKPSPKLDLPPSYGFIADEETLIPTVFLFVRRPPPPKYPVPLLPLITPRMSQTATRLLEQLQNRLVNRLLRAVAEPTLPVHAMGLNERRLWLKTTRQAFHKDLTTLEKEIQDFTKQYHFALAPPPEALETLSSIARLRPAWQNAEVQHGLLFADLSRIVTLTPDAAVLLSRREVEDARAVKPVVQRLWGGEEQDGDAFYVTEAQHQELLLRIQARVDLIDHVLNDYERDTADLTARVIRIEQHGVYRFRLYRSRQMPASIVTFVRTDFLEDQRGLLVDLQDRRAFEAYFAEEAGPNGGLLPMYGRWFALLARYVKLGAVQLQPMVNAADNARQRLEIANAAHAQLMLRVQSVAAAWEGAGNADPFPADAAMATVQDMEAVKAQWQQAVTAIGPAQLDSVRQQEAQLAPLLSQLTTREQGWLGPWSGRTFAVTSEDEQKQALRALRRFDKAIQAAEQPVLDLRAELADLRQHYQPEVIEGRDKEEVAKWSSAKQHLRPWYEDEGEPGVRPAWINADKGEHGSELTLAKWQQLTYDPDTGKSSMQPRVPTQMDEYLRATLYSPQYRQELDTIAAQRQAMFAEEKARRERDRAQYMTLMREQQERPYGRTVIV